MKQAEADFQTATAGINDSTPLLQATAAFNSAAFALEVAWSKLLLDANCLTDAQQAEAVKQITAYSVELQTDLATAGYYNGAVDGIYGPITLAAVEQLQTDSGLPVTGFVDQATAVALEKKLAKASLQTAALQSVLKLLGYYSGPVDGKWTPELTDALKQFQTASGLEPTGTVDTANDGGPPGSNRRAPAVDDHHNDRGARYYDGGDHHLAVDHSRGAGSPDRDYLTHSRSV